MSITPIPNNPKDNRASESALAELHGVVAKLLTSRLQSGDASTADINAAIKFLKDNGIDCAGSSDLRGRLERRGEPPQLTPTSTPYFEPDLRAHDSLVGFSFTH